MRKIWIVSVLPFFLAGILSASAVAAPSTGPDAMAISSPNDLAEVYSLSHDDPGNFAGALVAADGSVTVLVSKSAKLAKVKESTAKLSVSFKTQVVEHSLEDLLATQARIATYIESRSRPSLLGVGIEAALNGVVVYTATPEADGNWVADHFGKDILVREADPISAQGRQNDSPSFYGGGRLFYGPRGCTAGFTVGIGSTRYMLTAGHCYDLSKTISNGNYAYAVGSVSKRQYGNNQLDVEFIGGKSYAGSIFTGSASTSTSAPVRYLGYGCGYCYVTIGGSYTGDAASKIQSSDPSIGTCFMVGTVMTCGLVKTRSDSSRACQDGDSGAPIYTKSSGLVTAIGIHVGGTSDGRQCYYTILGRVLGYYGAQLATN